MDSSWTDKRTVLRDLYRAQGYNVPVEIDNAVSADDRPPAIVIKEETEESFYADCVGDGDVNVEPDLELIQQMLNVMRQKVEDDNIEVLSPKDTKEDEIKVESVESGPNGIYKGKSRRPKVERNVAIASLLAGHGNVLHSNEAEDKVILQTHNDLESHSPDKSAMNNKNVRNKLTSIAPVTMFKRKTKAQSNVDTSSNRSTPSNGVIYPKMFDDQVSDEYIPSVYANELFQSYLEKNKLQQMKKKDLWTDAERKMKEIEARRKTEQVLPSLEDVLESAVKANVSDRDADTMYQQQHLMNKDSVVCDTLCDKREGQIKSNDPSDTTL